MIIIFTINFHLLHRLGIKRGYKDFNFVQKMKI